MRIILLSLALILSSLSVNAIECSRKQGDFINLADQFGPHLDQSDTGRCYAFASAKMIEASLHRTQNINKYSIDPNLLAADFYAFAKNADLLESLEQNLKNKNGDLFNGGDQHDILRMITTKSIPVFSRIDGSLPAQQLKVCESNTRKYYETKVGLKKTQSFLKTCMSTLNQKLKNDPSVLSNIPDLSLLNVYDVGNSRGCTDSVLSEILDSVLCQNIPMITSLDVPFDPGDADNPHPINLYELSSTELEKLKKKTSENLEEKKYSRVNTNMMKHAIIVSGKITLGQIQFYILKNSHSAEYALLPESEVCSLSRAQALVTKTEAQNLKQTLRQIVLSSEVKKKSNRKPTSNK